MVRIAFVFGIFLLLAIANTASQQVAWGRGAPRSGVLFARDLSFIGGPLTAGEYSTVAKFTVTVPRNSNHRIIGALTLRQKGTATTRGLLMFIDGRDKALGSWGFMAFPGAYFNFAAGAREMQDTELTPGMTRGLMVKALPERLPAEATASIGIDLVFADVDAMTNTLPFVSGPLLEVRAAK